MQYHILDKIHSPQDVKALPEAQIQPLLGEIRSFLVEHVTKTGGHLASNLGVVELTVALHRVFSVPQDRIIFDVGHQCYVHKLLTGRREAFDTLRQNGGLSGFPKPSESPCDPFISGHSSTSVSIASGFAEADRLLGRERYTIAVVGDGAYTGGLIHEALNNVRPGEHLIVVLNENEMSISPNTGKFAEYLARLRSTDRYFNFKRIVRTALGKLPLIGRPLVRRVTHVKQNVKSIIYRSNYIEDLGFQYLGPIDGNDYSRLYSLLEQAKLLHDNVVVHIKTKKGLGYLPAEKAPDRFHSVAPQDEQKTGQITFSKLFGETLAEAMHADDTLVAITAAMPDGTGLSEVAKRFPERFYDIGIAEAHAVTFSAGLAAAGIHPVFAVYSSFLQRAYDNLLHDVGILSEPVTLCIDRAGFNEGDGVTHHGIFDVAFLAHLHALRLYAPVREADARIAFAEAFAARCPCAVRYARGGEHTEMLQGLAPVADTHLLMTAEKNCDVIFITYGNELAQVQKAAEHLRADGIRTAIITAQLLFPAEQSFAELAGAISGLSENAPILFAEEGIKNGGYGMLMQNRCYESGMLRVRKSEIVAIEDPTLQSEPWRSMYQTAKIDGDTLYCRAKALLSAKQNT